MAQNTIQTTKTPFITLTTVIDEPLTLNIPNTAYAARVEHLSIVNTDSTTAIVKIYIDGNLIESILIPANAGFDTTVRVFDLLPYITTQEDNSGNLYFNLPIGMELQIGPTSAEGDDLIIQCRGALYD